MIAVPNLGVNRSELTGWLIQYGSRAAEIIELPIGHRPHNVARNYCVKKFLASDCELLWFIDDDILPCNNAAQLLFLDWPAVSGLCYYYRNGRDIPAATINGKPIEVNAPYILSDTTGAACLVVHRNVLEAMQSPWFNWEFNEDGSAVRTGEDGFFTRRIPEKILLATEFPCLHITPQRSPRECAGQFMIQEF